MTDDDDAADDHDNHLNISSFPQHCPAVFLQMIPLSSSPLTMRTSFGGGKDVGQTDAFCDLFQDVLLESVFFSNEGDNFPCGLEYSN